MLPIANAAITWDDQEDAGIPWFAIDLCGAIAEFSSGLGPIHMKARQSRLFINRVASELELQPKLPKGTVDPNYMAKYRPSGKSLLGPFLDSAVYYTIQCGGLGIYSYTYPRMTYSDVASNDSPYERYIIPSVQRNVRELTPEIEAYLQLIRIDVHFSLSPTIDPSLIYDEIYLYEKDK